MKSPTSEFVRHGLTARFEDMPPSALSAVKIFLLDSLGVGIAGAGNPLAARVRQVAQKWGAGNGAHIWGGASISLPAPNAAFVNGFQIHCQEYDCVHEPAVVHPMAVILSAIMAEIEQSPHPVSGKELAIALAVAVDLAAGLGVAAHSPIRFFRPANAGLFGATLAISRLREFDEQGVRDALGYALAFCSGTMQAHVEGKPALPLQIANAARAAIMAADIAESGIPGPQDSLEGPYGYLKLFEDSTDLAPVAGTLGRLWRIAEVSHKPFPTGRAAQGGIVLMQKLLQKGVDPAEIDRLVLSAPPLIERLVGRPVISPMTANHARLCFQYVGARALLYGHVGLHDFDDTALCDPATLELARRIRVESEPNPDPAAFVPQTARVDMRSGQQLSVSIDRLYGSPADPMSQSAHLEKFRACVEFGFGRPRTGLADRLIELTDKLETLQDTRQLSRIAAGMER